MLFTCGIVIFLIVITAFFSASETAITFSSRPHIHQLAKAGNKKASIVQNLQGKLPLVIGVILTCNTFVNALIVSIGQNLITSFFDGDYQQYALAFAPIIMGTIVLIFAEIMPKMLALENTTGFLLFGSRILQITFWIFQPLNILINKISKFILRCVGIKAASTDIHDVNREELIGAIDMHKGPHEDVQHERAMLKSILDLSSVQVGEIMVHRQNVTMVNIDDDPEAIIDQVLACPFTRVPLWKDNSDNVIGVLNTKAIFRTVRSQNKKMTRKDIENIALTPWFVPESTDLLDQLHAFRSRREHFSLVIDEYGSLMGIVTLEDILEEIVGDINDEHDVRVRGVRPQANGSYVVYGNVTIRDLNRQFEWDLPDDHAATIAGLLIYEFRMIPKINQIFNFRGFRFETLRRQNNQVTLIRITPPSALIKDTLTEENSK